MTRAQQAALIREAVGELLKKDLTIVDLQRDIDLLGSVAVRLGVARSELGVWMSPTSRRGISMDGYQALAKALQTAGATEAARHFVQRMALDPVGMRLDATGRQGSFI